MDEMTRRAALRAAAKVALGSTFLFLPVLGCGGATHGETSEDPRDRNGERMDFAASPPDAAEIQGAAEPATQLDAASESVATVDSAPRDAGASSYPLFDGGLACIGPVTLADAYTEQQPNVTDTQFDCCLGYAAAQFSGSSDAASTEDDALVNCCSAIIARVEADRTIGSETYYEAMGPVRDACCFGGIVAPATDLYAYILCTPWGPPVPPAMDFLAEVA